MKCNLLQISPNLTNRPIAIYCFNSFNLYKNGKLPKLVGVEFKLRKRNEKFNFGWSNSPQNLQFGYFTPLFCRGWQRKVPIENLKRMCRANQLFCGIAIALVPYGPALLDSKLGNLMKELSVVMLNYFNLLDPDSLRAL